MRGEGSELSGSGLPNKKQTKVSGLTMVRIFKIVTMVIRIPVHV